MLEVTNSQFSDEQKAYIRKYAAGLLVSWTHEHVYDIITPDVGDGFLPPDGLFTVPGEDPYSDKQIHFDLDAHTEVLEIIDRWFNEIAKIAGFSGFNEVPEPIGDKYPTMKD